MPPKKNDASPVSRLKALKVEDALAYLNEVKREFQGQPQIYNEFLELMKDFKAQAIDTPGIIRRVTVLFRGHNDLILGFNTFLPEGHQIELSHIEMWTTPPAAVRCGPHCDAILTAAAAADGAAQQPPPSRAKKQDVPDDLPEERELSQAEEQPAEFDHAINYVTNIKRTFAAEPEKYRVFLDILQTYQREQKEIKEVLEEVSTLFADHPDLLKNFIYFLPDAVQEQAKAHLDRNAPKVARKPTEPQVESTPPLQRERSKVEVAQEQEFIRLIATANAPVFGVDTEGKVTLWNKCVADLTGYTEEEMVGHHLTSEFITSDSRVSVQEVLDRALQGEEAATFEFQLLNKGSSRAELLLMNATSMRDPEGRVVGVVGAGQLADSKQAAEAAKAAESRAAALEARVEELESRIRELEMLGDAPTAVGSDY